MSNSIDQDRIEGGVYFSDPIHIGDEPKFEFDSIGTDRFGDQLPSSLDIQSPSLANRRKRRPGTMGPGEKTFRNIVLEELQNFHTSNEDDFKRKNKELSQSIDNEVAEFRKTLNSAPNTYNQDGYVQEYEFLQHKAAAAREEYTSKTPTAYAFYGESPLYLSKELPFRRVTELTQDKALNTLEQMQKVWTDWDNTTKAAARLAAEQAARLLAKQQAEAAAQALAQRKADEAALEEARMALALVKASMPQPAQATAETSVGTSEHSAEHRPAREILVIPGPAAMAEIDRATLVLKHSIDAAVAQYASAIGPYLNTSPALAAAAR